MPRAADYNAHAELGSDFVHPDAFPVTPSDATDLARPVRGLRANVAGTISVITAAGETRSLNFAAGETRNIMVTRVNATGTTATGIEALV